MAEVKSGNSYIYQRFNTYFATVCDGVEKLLEEELLTLGVKSARSAYRGVQFKADQAHLYKANYCSRLASRIFAPLLQFDCHSTRYLHKTAMKITWEDFLDIKTTFAINATVSHSHIRHSKYASLCLKDAIADYFRSKLGERPSVDTGNPQIRFNLHIHQNKALISVDSSGEALHKRGYRIAPVEAPMQESVAAAFIQHSGWDGRQPLYDPMCGSGTLLSEAMLKYCRLPAAWQRKNFGFQKLPDFNSKLWKQVRQECDNGTQPLPKGLISGSDIERGSVNAARKNVQQIPGGENIKLSVCDFKKLKKLNNHFIICNPPYGVRLGNKSGAGSIYRQLADWLNNNCQHSKACIYFGKPEHLNGFPLKPQWKKSLKNGGISGLLTLFEI